MDIIEQALATADKMNPPRKPMASGSKASLSLSANTSASGSLTDCELWDEWEDRNVFFPGLSKQDVGIDAVGRRRSDGRAVAIQCKSRKLDEHGVGGAIGKSEIDKFVGPSSHAHFAERWIVTNGANPATENAIAIHEHGDKPIKLVNIVSDMRSQQAGVVQEDCPHCDDPSAKQTKSCMQDDAIDTSVSILQETRRFRLRRPSPGARRVDALCSPVALARLASPCASSNGSPIKAKSQSSSAPQSLSSPRSDANT